MKKYLYAVFFSALMLQTGADCGDKIRYAIFPAPPYMIGADREGQDVSGIDVEIVREIAKRMKLEIEYVRCPWALADEGVLKRIRDAYYLRFAPKE
jgi:polar amino acid transport system substrate-binding protein